MRGFIIMLSIFSVMLALVCVEEIYVNNVSDELSYLATYENVKTEKEMKDLKDRWKKEYEILVFFINQRELDNVTTELITAESYLKSGSIDLYKAYLSRARARIEKIPEY